jgi:acyl-CoA dehydrogenase
MVPVSHLLWAHIWLGIATDAFDRARAFVRAAARRAPGQDVPAAVKLSHVMTQVSMMRAEVHSAMEQWNEAESDREKLSTMAFALRVNNLKLAASEQAPRICQQAMGVCGIVGFKNDTPFSVGRHLRDSMSASLMVANERIHQTNAGLLMIAKEV